ncbi:SH3 domain-containing protein [Chondromyces apiculatus]|uniref:SH3b domain-containing protein n=1 Tax=Chondromyces apiculatus DSM 436 TaxID=1192034 RepID=A0A017SZL4_9BACT|nr:SH3 domain-containing protein [Chondromyces apiculatus]EYF02025.1 Hypothetical protein CAP_7504 [Chondromyces apiculatus DSM 436]
MATVKKERPLVVSIPRPSDEQPVWSKVGIVALIGFVVGVAWPRVFGVRIGPGVPGEGRSEAEAAATAAPAAPAPVDTAALAAPAPAPDAAEKNTQLVVIAPGTVTRCADKKNKKVDECDDLRFDPIALPKLNELSECPSAVGLEGKLTIGIDLNFEKKELQVVAGKKKSSLPSSTVNGILQCAARELNTVSLDAIAHKHPRYSLAYNATFYPPGKHPGDAKTGEGGEGSEAGSPGNDGANGTADIAWDTALVRSEPKSGDVVLRLVRGTRVKLIEKRDDWYKIDHRGKSGWVFRGAIGQ